jgi:general secretion pathway protein A
MYHKFFGLSKDPFSMTPDPAFLFLTAPHREALAGLTYSILNRKGFVVLTGDAGTGKTTLLSRIFQSIPSARARFSVVLNPTLTPAEFLELMLLDFGLSDIPTSKAQRLTLLQQFLIEVYQNRQVAALVVDEAHRLPPDVLEEIRLLSNFELAEAKLLQIVLSGQTELGDLLNRQDLRQLKQRVSVRLAIHPLSAAGVEHYIQHRWQKAGATTAHPFDAAALARVAQCSRGIPRLVNSLCDNALMLAFAEGETLIGDAQILEAARDLDQLSGQRRPSFGAPTRPDLPQPAAAKVRTPDLVPSESTNGSRGTNGTPGPLTVPTLQRYEHKPSRLMRLAGKLGLATRQ